MKGMVLGRYIPLNTPIHKMDPRLKIVSMVILMTAIFMSSFVGYAVLFVFLAGVIILSKLTFKFIIKAMKPMLFMLIFLSVINIFLLRTGYVLLTIGSFKIYSDALIQTAFIVVRLMLIVMVTTILMATTTPMDLTLAIEDLLSPLKVIKVPAAEIAMMISITLRFIPTLIEDTMRIMNAQASRGVDLQEGKIMERITGIVSMIIPLFVSSYLRAEDLAYAMEARGYYPGKKRSRFKQLQITGTDIFMFVVTCAISVGTVMIGIIK